MDHERQIQDRSALVAYGSETGNSQDLAHELGLMLQRLHFRTRVSNLDALNTKLMSSYTIVIIVISTTGQGDLPINSRLFWRSLLLRKLAPTCLQGVQFSVFGLGDSSYPKFNWAARKLHKRLLQLGAKEINPRGEADEQHDEGLYAGFIPWTTDLRQCLLREFPLSKNLRPISETEFLEPEWRLSFACEIEAQAQITKPYTNGVRAQKDSADYVQEHNLRAGTANSEKLNSVSRPVTQRLTVKLTENRRVTPEHHWQDVRHLAFNSDSQAEYGPGDVLIIQPKNVAENVQQMLSLMHWTDIADRKIIFTSSKLLQGAHEHSAPPISIPEIHTTLRAILTSHLDLMAIPRRSFFSQIAHFTDDQNQKDRLLEFTRPEYLDELYDYTTRPRRSLLEVLQEFNSVKIPWKWAASILPELRGRQFSIASGGPLKKDSRGNARFELLVAIVKYKTVIKKIREGICTRYLADLAAGTELDVMLQKGGLNITKADAHRPIVMVGPGTGIAPMRSLIREKYQWLHDLRSEQQAGSVQYVKESLSNPSNILLFGCRNKAADYFYREEWESLLDQDILPLEIHAAFSRDQSRKVYVQDLIEQQSGPIHQSLHDSNGLIFVCGSSGKMPQAVRNAIEGVFMRHSNMDEEAARDYLVRMEREGRYKQETW